MEITIIGVGKLKEKYLKDGIAEYQKRMKSYAPVNIIELPDEPAPNVLSDAELNAMRKIKKPTRVKPNSRKKKT